MAYIASMKVLLNRLRAVPQPGQWVVWPAISDGYPEPTIVEDWQRHPWFDTKRDALDYCSEIRGPVYIALVTKVTGGWSTTDTEGPYGVGVADEHL